MPISRTSLALSWHSVCAATLALLLAGCSVLWISPYSKDASDRVADLSADVLAMYADLLTMEMAQRPAAVAGPWKARQARIETRMRIHLLQEQARARNAESIAIAENMLHSWRTFGQSHARGDPTALSDETLGAERQIMERHLGAALRAEEAKKFGGS